MRFTLPLLLLLLVAALAASAPATLLDARISALTAERLRIADAAGTVWRGSGVLTDARGAWGIPLAWRASPLAALRGVADVEFVPQGRIVANGGVTLTDVRVALPARVLAAGVPAAVAVEAGGELLLDAPAFRYDGRAGDGALTLRWDRARIVVNDALVDLGTVTTRVSSRGDGLAGTLSNEGGALRVAGDLTWSNGQASVNATLAPAGTLPPEIIQALRALGPADASGAVRVAWRGALR